MERRRLRLIPRCETYPGVVSFVASPVGKLANVGVFSVGLYLHERYGLYYRGGSWWLEAAILFLLLSFLPQYRRGLILAATVYTLARGYTVGSGAFDRLALDGGAPSSRASAWVVSAAVLGFCVGYYKLCGVLARRGSGHRPLTSLLVLYAGMLVAAWGFGPGGVAGALLWTFLVLLGKYVWFLAYALADNATPATPEIGLLRPFWMHGTATPFPKGPAYLRKVEAKTADELAVSQIKATKLLYWAGGLALLQQFLFGLVPTLGRPRSLAGMGSFVQSFRFEIPDMDVAFQRSMSGDPFPPHVGLLALAAEFLSYSLSLAVVGHIAIAMCRMAGFNALRNMYNPLASRSIAEFWNRYYFYFKELLVDMFFYPSFLRYFKRSPRLRTFFATMSAAFFGNCVYHLLDAPERILEVGPLQTLFAFRHFALYAVVLAAGIGLSQLFGRAQGRGSPGLARRTFASVRVCAFYCLLVVLYYEGSTDVGLMDRATFLYSLLRWG